MNSPSGKPVWFITGCSTGFGRELAKHVLELGYRTVVTSRNPADVADLAESGEALILKLDVTDRSQVGFCAKLVATAMVVLIANSASADQFIGHQSGREVVVHTSPLPVFLHRLVPPNYGRHVTVREYQATRRTTQPIDTRVPNSNSSRQVKNRR